jgi:hypothetical protein
MISEFLKRTGRRGKTEGETIYKGDLAEEEDIFQADCQNRLPSCREAVE